MTSPAITKLKREFYLRPTVVVARELLGCYLCRQYRNELLIGRIVEVEAYPGINDPASHSFIGQTRRNATMFREGGRLYVYFIYGMHFCANVVTGAEGAGAAVLLRALEPLRGIQTMRRNRFEGTSADSARPDLQLCNGPAKLCNALKISGDEDGTDLCGREIWVGRGEPCDEPVTVSRRVGIRKGVSRHWRFFLKGNSFVSAGKPA